MGGLAVVATIVGVTAAISVDYADAAKPAKGDHAKCASRASKARSEHANRRAKCKKARKVRRRRSDGARTVRPATGTGTTGTGTTGGAPTGTGTPATGTSTTGGGATGTGTGGATTGAGATGTGTTTGGGSQVPEPLPSGLSVITFQLTEETVGPEVERSRRVVKTGAITVPQSVAEVIALINSEKELPANFPVSCPGLANGARLVTVELQFRDSVEGEPVAVAEASNPSCGGLMSVAVGADATRRFGSNSVVALVERLG